MKTKRLVTDALCAAMYVVLSFALGLRLGPMKISLDGLPILLGAMLFGPVDGLIIGLLGNFISQLLEGYITATTALWMLPPGLLGFMVGWYAKRHDFTLGVKKTALLFFAGLVADTTLTTGVMWVDCLVYKYSFVTYSPYIGWRYAADVIKAAIYTLVVPPLIKAIRRIEK